MPAPDAIAAARAQVGMHLVQLNAGDFTVRFLRDGVTLDLGAIGKGYAIERAGELLRENGIAHALLHGGTSSIVAMGQPPGMDAWKVAIEPPENFVAKNSLANSGPLAVIALKDESLSVSAIWGKFFRSENKAYGHILDPRTGQPASRAVLAAVVLPSATESDALSTALLTAGIAGHDQIATLRPGMSTLVLETNQEGAQLTCRAHGIGLLPGWENQVVS
jgi:FAD:protein FMN transferase